MNYISRLEIELKELQNKIDNLKDFILSNTFDELPETQQNLLEEQYVVMGKYKNILRDRLYLIKGE